MGKLKSQYKTNKEDDWTKCNVRTDLTGFRCAGTRMALIFLKKQIDGIFQVLKNRKLTLTKETIFFFAGGKK